MLLFHSGSRERWVALLLTLLSAAPSHETVASYPTAAQFRNAIFEPDLCVDIHEPSVPGPWPCHGLAGEVYVLAGFYFHDRATTFFVADSSAKSADKVPHFFSFSELLVRLRRQRNITILCA